ARPRGPLTERHGLGRSATFPGMGCRGFSQASSAALSIQGLGRMSWCDLPVHRRTLADSGARWGVVAEAAALARRQLAVAADVAVLAADDDVDRVLAVAQIADLAHGRGVDPGESARVELVLGAVAELELDAATVHEIELLLLLVQVVAGLIAGRDDDRVGSERGHAQALADLAEPVALAEVVETRDGVAVSFDHAVGGLGHRGRPRPPAPAAEGGQQARRAPHRAWRPQGRSAGSRR